jgi:hypothetical protein
MGEARQLAILHRQISGDEALLRLAQHRFAEAGLGAEVYPSAPEELRWILELLPAIANSFAVHLPRDISLLERSDHDRVCGFAAAARQATVLVVHDQWEVATHFSEYAAAVRALDARLQDLGPGPAVAIEYAVGLDPEVFVALQDEVRECTRISACIDIGHLGMRHCYVAFAHEHPGMDICRLRPEMATMREKIDSIHAVCQSALPHVLDIIAALGGHQKPLHFHLHDAHPCYGLNPYGGGDHLSFFQELPLPFGYRGSYTLPTLYGPLGLARIVEAARAALPDAYLSFTLEIHPPPEGRITLREHAPLFQHWTDLTNAERMQHWIEVLLRNHRLLQEALTEW